VYAQSGRGTIVHQLVLIFELACLVFETQSNLGANIDPDDSSHRSLVADRLVDTARTPDATRFSLTEK